MPIHRLLLQALACVLLTACAAVLGPRTVEVSEARLQALIAKQFPVKNRVLELLDVTVSTPRLTLRPESNRIATELEVNTSDRFLKTPYRGLLALTYGVRFEPSDNTIRLTNVRVERFQIDGAPAALQRQLDRVGTLLAEQALDGHVLHTLRPKDIEAVQGRGYRPSDIRVTPQGLVITLTPI